MGSTPKRLNMYSEIDGVLVIPYGMRTTLLKLLKEHNIEYELKELHKDNYIKFEEKNPLNLYDYQKLATMNVLQHRNGILISPAGSGKTRMAMNLIKQRGVKTLWLTHTLDLLRQSKRVYREFFKNPAGEISGGKINIKDITFATVQTLNNVDLGKYRDEFDLIIIDETHRVGGTPNRVSMFYKVLSNLNAKYKYGLTATLFAKQNEMSSVPNILIGDTLYEVDIENVSRVTAKHKPILLDTKPSDVYLKPDRTLDYHKLSEYLIYDIERSMKIVENMLKYKDRYNIVLSNRNDHLFIMQDLLEIEGIKVEVLVGEVKAKERERILKDFEKGKFHYLLSNYQLAKEGLDMPIADILHLTFPMRDKRTIIQSKGRVERQYKDKTESIVFDYVDKNIGVLVGMFNERKRYLW